MDTTTLRPRVIVALDVEKRDRALEIVTLTSPAIGLYKVGSRLFTSEGPAIVKEIGSRGASVFLDLKFHDIPATVEGSVRAATALGVAMMTIHTSGGLEMMRAAARAASDESKRLSIVRPIVVGVTVLTSLSKDDLSRTFGTPGTVRDLVLRLATQAREAGLDGVVASVEEARPIKDELGEGFKVVTPGIRPAGAAAGDQKRIATPRAAREAGSDYLVVGRPIIEAPSPRAAAEQILRELEER
ncbi:MAG TPA: orotidine-5'-phosphate decarboxylase [Candidatus Krumholzibacteriaceae bacterium]